MGETKNAYKTSVENLKGKDYFGNPRHRWRIITLTKFI
jgi:hypothetical protein